MWKKVSVVVLGLALLAQEAMAQVFPVDAATTTTIVASSANTKASGTQRSVHAVSASASRATTPPSVSSASRTPSVRPIMMTVNVPSADPCDLRAA